MLDDLVVQSVDSLLRIVKEKGLTETVASTLSKVIGTLREVGKEPDLRKLQDEVYKFYSGMKNNNCPQETAEEIYRLLNFSL